MYISDSTINQFIKEDVPYIDLTTWVLGIGDKRGKIQFFSREEAVPHADKGMFISFGSPVLSMTIPTFPL